MAERRAIVIGAGPGGLAAAIALRSVGFDAVVYERDERPGLGGAGLAIAPNAMRALRRLGCAEALRRDAAAPPRAVEIRTAKGRPLTRIDLAAVGERLGEPSLAVRREALQAALLSALPHGIVRTGRACVAVSQDGGGARAEFADGAGERADVVVGADGLRSVVRAALGTGRVRYTGSTSWRTLVPARRVPFVGARSSFEAWGRGVRFGMVHLGEHVYCYATAPAPEATSAPGGEKRALLRLFARFAAPVPELVSQFEETAIIRTDINELVGVERWVAGHLVVIGDAAHAMTPDLGQGACQALEDAVFLGAALADARDLPSALRHFQATRRARPERVARRARSVSRLVQSTNPVTAAVRDGLARLTTTAAMTRRYRRLADVELPALG